MLTFLMEYVWEIVLVALVLAAISILLYNICVLKKHVKKPITITIISICVLIVAGIGLFHFFSPPDVRLNGEENVVVDVFGEYDDLGITVTSGNGEVIDPDVAAETDLDTDITGEYIVNYSFNYRHRTYSISRNVKVIDEVSPEIVLVGESVVAVEDFDDYQEEGCVINDNYDGDISDNVEITYSPEKDYKITVTYKAADSSGNESVMTREVDIRDITPPVVELKGYKTETIAVGSKYSDSGAEAYDTRDGDVTGTITTKGSVNTKKEGTYTIKYFAKDFTGNVGVETRTVRVVSPEKIKGKNIIYLTFDDGPSTTATKKILDVLKKNNVKATFFILNFDTKEKADLIKRMVNEGHTVAVHGYSHEYKDIYASEEAFMKNTDSLRDKIYVLTGYKTVFLRFPGGSSNTVSDFNPGIMTRLTKLVTDEGYIYFDWNVDSGDASGGTVTANTIYYNTVTGLKENRGNVVLMHDVGDGDMKAKAIQRIIDYGKRNGYEFACITEATKPVHHNVSN